MASIDPNAIREMNEKLVKEVIIKYNSISRADISREIGLNKASVSAIIHNLLDKQIVKEIGSGKSITGRKPILISLNENSGITLSFDIQKNNIRSAALNMNGDILLEKNIPAIKIKSSSIFEYISKTIKFYQKELPKSVYGIVGISIGIHGIVIGEEVRFSPFYDLNKINLKYLIEDEFNIPTIIENEANLSVLGEKLQCADDKNLVNIIVSDGIGAGIIYNDKLFRGQGHYAGEIGHMVVDFNGKKCVCGNYGCVELYASETNLLANYGKKIGKNNVNFSSFKADFLNNLPHTEKTIDDFIKYMSLIINNLSLSISPEIILINSRFTSELDGVIEKIINNINCKTIKNVEIRKSALGNKAIIYGGFWLCRNKFLKIN